VAFSCPDRVTGNIAFPRSLFPAPIVGLALPVLNIVLKLWGHAARLEAESGNTKKGRRAAGLFHIEAILVQYRAATGPPQPKR
jgi:hypothetical protein